MKKINIKRFIIFYLLTVIIGTLSHFAYDFLNEPIYLKALFPIEVTVDGICNSLTLVNPLNIF